MVRPLRAALVLATAVPLALAAGCGSGSSSNAASTTTPAPATTAPATTTVEATTPPAATPAKVAVAADPSGALAFVQKTLTARGGSVTFDFTNASSVPHNLTFEKAGTEEEAGGTSTITGGSTSVTLTLAKGTYNFYCSVPGHEDAGMKGTLTVT